MKTLIFFTTIILSSTAFADGKEVFNQVCARCHLQGMLGAPKFGNHADWSPRIKEGRIDLIAEAYSGIRLMPAKGGRPDLSLEEFSSAVICMTNQAGANWQMPTPSEYQKINKTIQKKIKAR